VLGGGGSTRSRKGSRISDTKQLTKIKMMTSCTPPSPFREFDSIRPELGFSYKYSYVLDRSRITSPSVCRRDRFCLFVLERPCSVSQESPLSLLKFGSPTLESSLSPLLGGLIFSDTEAPTSMKQAPLLQSKNDRPLYKVTFCNFFQTVHPGRPFTPVREGSKNVFPSAAFISHLG
jgi:hypothetical protein